MQNESKISRRGWSKQDKEDGMKSVNVPVDEIVVETELQDKGPEGPENLSGLTLGLAIILWQAGINGEDRGTIHCGRWQEDVRERVMGG